VRTLRVLVVGGLLAAVSAFAAAAVGAAETAPDHGGQVVAGKTNWAWDD
jgi:ABC-type proline/glycine betaine transport system substrate-binding protein